MMQPETYLLRFIKTEAKTPTNFVNQIFFAFCPSPKTGKKERKIAAQSQLTFIVPPPFGTDNIRFQNPNLRYFEVYMLY
jgi:hypothetical protein